MVTNRSRSFQNDCVIDTVLSDFHKITVTVLRSHLNKLGPKIIHLRNYKNFLNDAFRFELVIENGNLQNFNNLDLLLAKCKNILNRTAPLKQKHVRVNNSPFVNKTILKAIMKRTRLKNKFIKYRCERNKRAYNAQRNLCVSLVRKAKKEYFDNLDLRNITDNKKFWKIVKPFFTDKGMNHDKIILVEDDEIILENEQISESLNNFFADAIIILNILQYEDPTSNTNGIDDPVLSAIEKYKNHPSIKLIKTNRENNVSFRFQENQAIEIEKELKNLDCSKASQDLDIPTKIIKDNIDIFVPVLLTEFNESLKLDRFPHSMKSANITPVFKKNDRTDKFNYRPVSILPNLSKVFERCIRKQVSAYFDGILPKQQCRFRKGFIAQHSLLKLLEKWRQSLDQGLEFGVLLTDLSKAFDCLSYELLAGKLSTYGVHISAVRFNYDYLSNRKQRTKIENHYSSWRDIIFGVPQESILVALLFNIYLCDLFMFTDNIDIASYADDITPYVSGVISDSTVKSLEKIADLLFAWANYNQMKGNKDKCHAFLSSQDNVHVNIGAAQIENSKWQKLLGIIIGSKLTFEDHVNRICKKASAKMNALGRILYYMDPLKWRLLVNAFFTSQFHYCPLTWMFHSRKLNNKINRLHERFLRLIYSDRGSSYEELLDKDNSKVSY